MKPQDSPSSLNTTIFDRVSIDRAVVRWEDYCTKLTPVQRVGSLWLKREDAFAPLGYGGINGGKVRQILWLVTRYLNERHARPGLLLAGSVKSPQLGRVAAVARHFGLPVMLVIGSKLETAYKGNENVRIAANLGAQFVKSPAPYNPVLQKVARDLHATQAMRDFYLMEYGLSVEGSDERVESFYRFCGEQIDNLPEEADTWIVPAGSCNTTLAVLYAIARKRPRGLKRVVLFGIGPTRIDWFEERLRVLERASKRPIVSLFRRTYEHHPALATKYGAGGAPYALDHHDLHASGFASYQDEMPASYGGVPLHPTYEGKILTYMQARKHAFAPLLESGRTVLWIVGGEPRWAPMEPHLRGALEHVQ